MQTGLASLIVRYRYLVVAVWAVVAVFAFPRASRVNSVLDVEGHSLKLSEAKQAEALLRTAFPKPVFKFFAVAMKGSTPVDSAPFSDLLEQLTRAAERQPFITRVVSVLNTSDTALVSSDRKSTFFIAAVAPEESENATDLVPVFRKAMREAAAAVPEARGIEVAVTGGPALDYDVRKVSTEGAKRSEERALPLTAIVLILAFGSLVAAALPLVVGSFAITSSLALVYVASSFHPMSVFVVNIVTMIGLATGIDYSLLVVTRFREELNRGLSPKQAAIRTMMTAGRAVVTSGLTVIVGFASLLILPTSETRSMGIGGLLVVTAAVLLSTTLLPAVLAILGRSIDKPRWLARRLAWYHAPAPWERWARWLGQHPWRAIVIGAVVIGAITWPLGQIKIGLPRAGWFPSGTESSRGVEILEASGARGSLQPVRVLITAPAGRKVVGAKYIRGLKRLSDSLKADPRIAQVRGPVDLGKRMSVFRYTMLYSDLDRARERYPEFFDAYISTDARTVLMDVFLSDTTSLVSSMDVIHRIRHIRDAGIRGLDSVTVLVGGFSASSVDLQAELLAQFPKLIALVLIITAVMLFIAFKSLLVPIKAVLMNVLSVAGAFGLIVLVFQKGVGGALFGVEGGIAAIYVAVPVMVFAMVFGLSMDYEVFLLSRMKEAFDRTHRNDQATMEGLASTASVITSAAAVMIIVFGTFSFSRVLAAQLMGFGLAVSVFLDATVIRMVLVPAIMHIAGRWNWWPGIKVTDTAKVEAHGPPSERRIPVHASDTST